MRFDFTDFSSISGLQLNGNATQAGTALQLTPALGEQVGSAFYTQPIAFATNTSFQTQFQFQLSGGTGGADGFTFILQNSPAGITAIGPAGGDLGYSGLTQSIAIEFDTYQNEWDPNDNHLALLQNGAVTTPLSITSTGVTDLNGGQSLNAWINYDGVTDTLDVFLGNSTTQPRTPSLSYQIDLASILGTQAFVGFSAGTGGLSNAHNINSWNFIADDNPIARFALKDTGTTFLSETAGVATITAVRTGNVQERVTLEYTTNEVGTGSATADGDYTTPSLNGRANTGQVIFEVGETEKAFTISILNDTLVENNETFAIGIQNPSAGTLGTPRTARVTILDDDSPTTITLSNATLTVSEGVPTANITVQRSGNVDAATAVEFATIDATAIAGADYTPTSSSITFAPGQVTQTIAIPIVDDALVEASETFSVALRNPTGAILGSQTTATITILDNDLTLGALTQQTAVSGLNQPTVIDWTPDGRYMLVAQKSGIVQVVDNDILRSTPLIDLSSQVNDTRDRGLLGFAIHPDFANTPYIYLAYTYDPPETAGRTGLAAPDGNGNRPMRVVRVTVDPTTMIADPTSLVVILGKNSIWEYISRPDGNSTGDTSIPPSGITNGTTIIAPADQIDIGSQDNDPDRPGLQNQNIRDYLTTDSESHTIGAVNFGPDGLLYVSTGDGTSYNFVDPRAVRVQDVANLSGKVLRIDPITGAGSPSNPFFNGDPNSNQSKVFYSGLRNPFRFTFDPITGLPVIGDVGWTRWDEINTGVPGANFGWPYLEGPEQTGGYRNLAQAIAFYNNGNINPNSPSNQTAVFPILPRSLSAPDNAVAIMVGDFYNSNTLMFGDINRGILFAATFDDSREIVNVQVLDANASFVVDLEMGPDGRLYGVDFVTGSILRWETTPA